MFTSDMGFVADSMAKLVQFLSAEKKYGEMEEATRDREKRHKLYRRYGIL